MLSFNLPLYTKQIDSREFNIIKEDTLDFIKNNKELFEPVWKCPTLSSINHPKAFTSETLLNVLKTITSEYFTNFKFETNAIQIGEIWVNIASQGDFQESHIHLDYKNKYLFSGVLYIEADENSGDLILLNPNRNIKHYMLNTPIMDNITIKPKPGLLVSFPSWLEHEVKPNNNKSNRISISWNIVTKNN